MADNSQQAAAIRRLLAAEGALRERLAREDAMEVEPNTMQVFSDESDEPVRVLRALDPDEPVHISDLGVAGALMMEAEALKWKRRAQRWKAAAKSGYWNKRISDAVLEDCDGIIDRLEDENARLRAAYRRLFVEGIADPEFSGPPAVEYQEGDLEKFFGCDPDATKGEW